MFRCWALEEVYRTSVRANTGVSTHLTLAAAIQIGKVSIWEVGTEVPTKCISTMTAHERILCQRTVWVQYE